MTIAFFDTETHKDWVCQLAVLLTTDTGETINSLSTIIHSAGRKPCLKYCLPVHGITIEKSDTYGISHEYALKLTMSYFSMADRLVAHNFSFDDRMLRLTADSISPEMLAKLVALFRDKENFCTMRSKEIIAFCGLLNKKGKPKQPKLTELHDVLFGTLPYSEDEHHDAMKDVQIMAKCYFELVKLGVI